MNFTDLLLQFRKDNALTQKEMAQRLGWTPMYYGRFENGNLTPTKRNIEKFSNVLNIPVTELLKYTK
ncbi:helix-turn-helix domain-containing protein [Ligilactobacillus salivarius]|uniref:helix-turn-helix domain-containing protein n=1 Tax=Ligilactobacillus salivarius TaxID=1624 RepID=UPI0015E80D4D|nr:helix-turn-helix transcriptional regulator [Ligilactobacillus salivarius]